MSIEHQFAAASGLSFQLFEFLQTAQERTNLGLQNLEKTTNSLDQCSC